MFIYFFFEKMNQRFLFQNHKKKWIDKRKKKELIHEKEFIYSRLSSGN